MTKFDAFYMRLEKAIGLSSQLELAKLLGVNRSAVTQAKRRDSIPAKWIFKISREFGLNPDWLESGRGNVKALTKALDETEYVEVPKVRARLCAGGGSFEVDGTVEEHCAFRFNWLSRRGVPGEMVLMDIFGNSMEPEIREGDTALIDQSQRAIIAGGIYAVGLEDTVMVKRVEKRPGTLVLLSDNPDYAPIALKGDEIEQARIIGKVVWVCREYR